MDDFSSQADEMTIFSFIRSISRIAKLVNLENGYRIISNIGFDGGQEVPHFHVHLIGGKKLGAIVSK